MMTKREMKKRMAAVALAVRTCPPALLTTLACLIERADRKHQCRLPQKRIAALTDQSERTVRYKLRKLESLTASFREVPIKDRPKAVSLVL
jgi:hypothetical protein